MINQYRGLHWESEGEEDDEDIEENFEFLPVSWISKWLANPNTCGPIDTNHLLCQHDNLDIDKLSEVKICDSDVVSILYDEFGSEGPRLDCMKMCRLCVANRARLISLDFKMNRDQMFLASQKTPSDGTGFWVGKRSFMRWKTLGKLALENQIVKEVTEWRIKEEASVWKARQSRKRKLPREDDKLCLDDLKAKLLRMGTNVSIATFETKHDPSAAIAGVSTIKSGEFIR